MADWVISLILALFIIVACWLALARRQEVQRQVNAWPALAQRTGLTLDSNIFNIPKALYHYPGLRGSYRGHSLTVKLMGDSERIAPPNTSISLPMQNCACCSLSIQSKTFHDYIHGITEFPSGNLDFDRRFSSKGAPPEYLQRAVDRIVRSDPGLLAWVLRNFPSIELKGDSLICSQNGVLTNVDDQKALLNLLCDLAELAEEMKRDNVKLNGVGREKFG